MLIKNIYRYIYEKTYVCILEITSKRKSTSLQSILPKPGECGQVKSTDEYQDENLNAQLGQFPWTGQIAYFYLNEYKIKLACNGVLINSNHVLAEGICCIPLYSSGYYRTGP